jgi:hypothetical protein
VYSFFQQPSEFTEYIFVVGPVKQRILYAT